MKTSELTGATLDRIVHDLLHPEERIKDGCTAPQYSTDWAHGGEIIEREGISLEWSGWGGDEQWDACIKHDDNYTGLTALIAAMRCYVASKLGDDVEMPASLNIERSKLIQRLISDDIYGWGSTDSRDEYLATILADGFLGYNKQFTEELQAEWNERLSSKGDTE